MVQGTALLPRLRRGPSACTRQPILSRSDWPLEVEHDARGNAQVVLRFLRGGVQLRKARQQVVHFCRAKRPVVAQAVIEATSDGHGEGSLAIRGIQEPGFCMRDAEKHFSERRDATEAMVRHAWSEQICGERAVYSGPQNVAVVVAAE